ncbi:SMEK domain-containing protein [Nostoc sp. NMS9]|uniref:SMEK domain-containing protein n=1 Tax=Nostoc sp. NMS9 TaxID=2815393 RepID=UPI0025E58848|nr:SMEK domain-containing protein [Nostoc sp. NMS9]MBN3939545.1 SMEK domain-containing protein [Nostoc sp. NMS9]
MHLEQTQQRIRNLMSFFVTEIKAATAMEKTDINKVSENVLIPLFAEIYGFKNLKNLNFTEGSNFPGIDLGDETAKVAFQITATPNINKIKHTLNKFIEYELYKKYDRLIIYILLESKILIQIKKLIKSSKVSLISIPSKIFWIIATYSKLLINFKLRKH